MAVKADTLTAAHLGWLVESRTASQKSALTLFVLLSDFKDSAKDRATSKISQDMVSVCFSLWRAAFLADKMGTRTAVIEDARVFLGKLLTDNAITYPQDRSNREFTFNYYMNNATDSLLRLSAGWPTVKSVLNTRIKYAKGATAPQRRWTKAHNAFKEALNSYALHLKTP